MKITIQIETSMKLDQIGSWSEIKLELIKKYAGAYTRILSRQDW